jgi:2-polyprenyl-3-methyl-5-hydroxy-6-metoxy-1,4-benzoquinol methylase
LLSGLNNKWEKYGIETDAQAVKTAAQYGTIINGGIEDVYVPSDSYDAVVLCHAIEHLKEPEVLIR